MLTLRKHEPLIILLKLSPPWGGGFGATDFGEHLPLTFHPLSPLIVNPLSPKFSQPGLNKMYEQCWENC